MFDTFSVVVSHYNIKFKWFLFCFGGDLTFSKAPLDGALPADLGDVDVPHKKPEMKKFLY